MITVDAISQRLSAIGFPDADVSWMVEQAGEALVEKRAGGDWFSVKTARWDASAANTTAFAFEVNRLAASLPEPVDAEKIPADTVKRANLSRIMAAAFKDAGEPDAEGAREAALAIVAGAIASEALGEASVDGVEVAGVTFEARIAEPARGGRTVLRLRDPAAAPAEEGEDGDAEAAEDAAQ